MEEKKTENSHSHGCHGEDLEVELKAEKIYCVDDFDNCDSLPECDRNIEAPKSNNDNVKQENARKLQNPNQIPSSCQRVSTSLPYNSSKRNKITGQNPRPKSAVIISNNSSASSFSKTHSHFKKDSRPLNLNHQNAASSSTPVNKFVDYFGSRRPFTHQVSSRLLLNTHPAKRPHNFSFDKAARPFTKSSKLYKPLSASLKSKQLLLSNKLPDIDFDIKPKHIPIEDTQIDISDYNNCKLPILILTNIFQYLSLYDLLCRTAPVCRYWYTAVFDPALWRFVNLSEQSQLTDEILVKLTHISDNILGIDLSTHRGSLHVFPQTIEMCLKRNKNLKTFNMARCFDMPGEAFESIGLYCHHLVHLDLDICSNITNEAIINIGKGCSQLKVLFVGQCSLIKNTGIVEVARGCPSLQQLRIEQCDKITDQAIIELTKYCPNMDYLHMLSCSLTDSSICQITKLTKLKLLDISNITQLSPKVLTKVVEHCNLLETLNVSLNRAVNDECIKTIVTACQKLRVLSCVACRLTDQALEYVADYGKCVEHLDVAWCVDITNYGVKYISDNNPKLRYLGLMQCKKITFDTIDELIEAHPDVHYSNFVTESRRILKKACLTVDNQFQTLNVGLLC